ncbi:MAG: nucleotidyl transferase AbiEii/AbiGii toxin family protein [Rhodocyclaceae bacterium]|nr:nucleotidyl transferase AbiEii/AbiGii toxin family protein [Rhodocyclaceae bacterium]
MNLFDRLVDQALRAQTGLAPLRAVVEKEILHHDILREMADAGLLHELTFIGGTCLRACYGSNRLSEDLNFTGGEGFDRVVLSTLGSLLVERLQAKYDLVVTVGEPIRDTGNVDTWKLRVVTRPEQRGLPAQRINIDIRAVPSYDRRPMLLRNPYGVDMGTAGLIIQAQSREEILADKLVALALRPNRLKNRDLWDIGWLKQQNVELPLELIPKKIADHRRTTAEFLDLLGERRRRLLEDAELRVDFVREMTRFLPLRVVADTVEQVPFWAWLTDLVAGECSRVSSANWAGGRR